MFALTVDIVANWYVGLLSLENIIIVSRLLAVALMWLATLSILLENLNFTCRCKVITGVHAQV